MSSLEWVRKGLADRYRLDRELGAGGMATVYLAESLETRQQVAIKVLREDLTMVLGRARFLREIAILKTLDHPRVLPVLDSGSFPAEGDAAAESLFYVMPYVDGESLRELLRREPQLPLDTVLSLARDVADAIDHAHSKGIVHRDIKPENILLSGGRAVVADFGIARALDNAGGTKLTDTGLALGTAAYMSPEQSLAQAVDGRTDVYALGSVVFESLVGDPPFSGRTTQAIIARRLAEPVPSIRVVRENVPANVERAVHRALARTAADRFTTAGAFVAAMLAPDTTARSRFFVRAAAIAAAVMLIAAAAIWWLRPGSPAAAASVIAVLPVSTAPATDTALVVLGQNLVSTIAADLGQVRGVRTVDVRREAGAAVDSAAMGFAPTAREIGRRVGARSVLQAEMRGVGTTVRLDVRLLAADSSNDTLAVATITAPRDSIFALTDSIAFSILRQTWRHGTPPSPSLASVTTHSMAALSAFLTGERLAAADHWSDAVQAYDAAFKLDTTFWLAAWRHNQAQQWIPGEPDLSDAFQRKYEAHVATFGERDRQLIAGEATSATEPYAMHLQHFERIADADSSDWAAIWPYADHLVHGGPLIGHPATEAMAALIRTVTLNPRLMNGWQHLLSVSAMLDSTWALKAAHALTGLGDDDPTLAITPMEIRLLFSAEPAAARALVDSIAASASGSPAPAMHIQPAVILGLRGSPGAEVALIRELMHRDADGKFLPRYRQTMAWAWGARGMWDSALAAVDVPPAATRTSPAEAFCTAVAGTWLGELDSTAAIARQAAAVRYRADTAASAAERTRSIACEAVLALVRHDRGALRDARAALKQPGVDSSRFVDRSVAAFDHLLAGDRRAAGDSLAALDLDATETELLGPRDAFARSVDHLLGAQLLLERHDTARAVKLLWWHQADIVGMFSDLAVTEWFAPAAYLQAARIADEEHRKADAIAGYRQFLRRHDTATPATQESINAARNALARLFGIAATTGP